jgi:hypothetical protein
VGVGDDAIDVSLATPATTPSGPRTPSALSLSLSPTTTTATSARHDRTLCARRHRQPRLHGGCDAHDDVAASLTACCGCERRCRRRQPGAVGDGVSVGLRHAHDDAVSPSTGTVTRSVLSPSLSPTTTTVTPARLDRTRVCTTMTSTLTACGCGRRCRRRRRPSRPRRRRQSFHGCCDTVCPQHQPLAHNNHGNVISP